MVIQAMLIPSFKGTKQLMSAYGALSKLHECRGEPSLEALFGKATEQESTGMPFVNHGVVTSDEVDGIGLPAMWHTPLILVLVEAMLLSPDLFFMQCCCSLIDRMMDDLRRTEHLRTGALIEAASDEARNLLNTAAVTFVQQVLLRLGPAIRQAWSVERRPSSPTFGKECGKHAAATGLVGQFVEGSCAVDAQGVLRLLGKVVFPCFKDGEAGSVA